MHFLEGFNVRSRRTLICSYREVSGCLLFFPTGNLAGGFLVAVAGCALLLLLILWFFQGRGASQMWWKVLDAVEAAEDNNSWLAGIGSALIFLLLSTFSPVVLFLVLRLPHREEPRAGQRRSGAPQAFLKALSICLPHRQEPRASGDQARRNPSRGFEYCAWHTDRSRAIDV